MDRFPAGKAGSVFHIVISLYTDRLCEEDRRLPLLPRAGNGRVRLRDMDPSAGLRDFVELGDIWVPEWDQNGELTMQAVANGERCGRVLQEYTRLVQSDSFEEDWTVFVQCWHAGGGDEMTVERNR